MTKRKTVDPAPYAARLQARLAELRTRLEGIEHDLDETPNPDAEERATEREGDEVLESLGAAGLGEIRAIEAALDRIEEGEFGVCVACGGAIAAGRLDAVPHAPRCAKCA
ncbi:TraR/DksA family transcriptional regulator [Rubrimonas cliftonensis]|uniref:Transcriptional regulator, TraR/DksA family n=1 Tax=Rubrimonas cliftonensis TaxID=89524 RepID=A0A1H3X3T4_9RHOB|nr:TraR/DksA C4-type zinc finger protein [Rubrimonas cliftonensis]SDZ93920.1 transcriptional regulator, TraR/DksA family [Rubrimonas cliftonensis]